MTWLLKSVSPVTKSKALAVIKTKSWLDKLLDSRKILVI